MIFRQTNLKTKATYEFKNQDFEIKFNLTTTRDPIKDTTTTNLNWITVKHDKQKFTYKPDINVRELTDDLDKFIYAYAYITDSGKVLTSIYSDIYQAIQNAAKKLEKPIPMRDSVSSNK